MNPQTERLIRSDIHLRRSPIYVALFVFFGSIAGFALLGVLGYVARLLQSSGHLH